MAYTVKISGTVLSSLLYQCANSITDIEGLFLGSLSIKTTMTTEDSADQAYEKREDFLLIHGYQILNQRPYDIQGNINKQVISSQQKDISSIVGYFKFRRQSDVNLSIRDQLWMNSYSSNIPHGCIAIISSSLNDTTHTYEFAFWDMKNKERKLPIQITNMTESSTLNYKSFMSSAPFKLLETSNNRILASMISPNDIIKQYDELYQQSMSSLQQATQQVIAKQAELEQLKQEVKKRF